MTEQHILIVDDNPMNVELLNRLLHTDYKISKAYNGIDALQIISEASD